MSAAPARTSAAPAVTAQDLELERAELLPARETLMVSPVRYYPAPLHPDHVFPWSPGGPGYFYPGPGHHWE
jgi:hypothetical protein